MKSVYLFLSWSQTKNVWAKLQTPFLLWFQIPYALADSGGTEFLSKTLRSTVCGAGLFTIQGCIVMFPVTSCSSCWRANCCISIISGILLLLFWKSGFHMSFLIMFFTKSMQDEENVLFCFLKSAFGRKICQGINWRSVLLNDEVSWRYSCPNSVISSGTGKHEIVSQAGMNFSSCSDFMLSLGLSALQISPVSGMYLVLAELLLLDSGCKNSLIPFPSFLGNEVCRLENYYCCYMWNLLSIWNHSSWIPASMWKAHIWQSAPNRAKWHHPASAAFSYGRIATLVVRKTFSLGVSLPNTSLKPSEAELVPYNESSCCVLQTFSDASSNYMNSQLSPFFWMLL